MVLRYVVVQFGDGDGSIDVISNKWIKDVTNDDGCLRGHAWFPDVKEPLSLMTLQKKGASPGDTWLVWEVDRVCHQTGEMHFNFK